MTVPRATNILYAGFCSGIHLEDFYQEERKDGVVSDP